VRRLGIAHELLRHRALDESHSSFRASSISWA
jgi:hypothetical protein